MKHAYLEYFVFVLWETPIFHISANMGFKDNIISKATSFLFLYFFPKIQSNNFVKLTLKADTF